MDATALTEGRLEAGVGWVRDDASPEPPSGLVPLVIGVTGHRDLRGVDREPLEAAVRELFVELRAAHPGRPLALLTALAEGADTLVTRVALNAGARLVVVLPMDPEEYERDFAGAAHADFIELLHNREVVRRVVVPAVGRTADRLDDEARRAVQYALAGAYIADHADVLIALWDGRPSDRVGGTAHVVHYRRAGVFEVDAATAACLTDVAEPFGVRDDLLAPPRVGFVQHIVTPRRSGAELDAAFSRAILPPFVAAPTGGAQQAGSREADAESVADVDARIRQLNDEAGAFARANPDAVDASAEDLYPSPDTPRGAALPPLPPGLASLRRSFALADALAIHHQRALNNALLWMFILIFVAGLGFALFTHEFTTRGEASPIPIITYAVLFVIADATFIFVKVSRWQDKYQDCRAIAEGLRVQFYWRLAGLEHSASEYYVRHHRDELAWIPRVARDCGAGAPPMSEAPLDAVQTLWAAPQAAYYARAYAREQRNLRWRYVGSGALIASLAIGFGLLMRASAGWAPPLVVVLPVAALAIIHVFLVLVELWREPEGPARVMHLRDIGATIVGLAASLGATALLVNVPLWFPEHPRWIPPEPVNWLFLSLGVTALAGGLLHAHSQVRAFAEHARRYGNLAAIFQRGAERLQTALDGDVGDRARTLIIELGKEALSDHGDWVILHRERPIELPEGGA